MHCPSGERICAHVYVWAVPAFETGLSPTVVPRRPLAKPGPVLPSISGPCAYQGRVLLNLCKPEDGHGTMPPAPDTGSPQPGGTEGSYDQPTRACQGACLSPCGAAALPHQCPGREPSGICAAAAGKHGHLSPVAAADSQATQPTYFSPQPIYLRAAGSPMALSPQNSGQAVTPRRLRCRHSRLLRLRLPACSWRTRSLCLACSPLTLRETGCAPKLLACRSICSVVAFGHVAGSFYLQGKAAALQAHANGESCCIGLIASTGSLRAQSPTVTTAQIHGRNRTTPAMARTCRSTSSCTLPPTWRPGRLSVLLDQARSRHGVASTKWIVGMSPQLALHEAMHCFL